MTIKITTLGHAVLRTPDLDRARTFYRDLLGLHDVASAEFDGQRWVFLSTGNAHHELALVEDPTTESTGPLHHLGLKIGDSLDELIRAKTELEAAGAQVHATLDFRVSQALIVSDPDGTTIELYVDAPGDAWRHDPSLVAFAAPLDI